MASILIVDDEDSIREIMAEILHLEQHQVTTAGNGKEGLDLFDRQHFDLIITDIVMPEMEGLELIQLLRKRNPCPRIIAVSGYSQFSKRVYLPTAQFFGAVRTLSKPFLSKDLLAAVDETLKAPAPSSRPPAPLT